ncbi:leukocyte surface antigen CD53-like isoform X1 [Gadus chalcogrammus]|uniref:leukocyte surface antigen CD53-like isoform X1 n=1 Tax=Gadus chalcogrammus TaxID=1042646 RepID=UPI0024C4DA26|nr:leukocyte surface antigen CD53-like isoform X1 [Gadus chalcogrammus]
MLKVRHVRSQLPLLHLGSHHAWLRGVHDPLSDELAARLHEVFDGGQPAARVRHHRHLRLLPGLHRRSEREPCFLLTFFILLLILMLVELTVACLLLTYESEIGTLLEKELNTGLQNEKRKNSTKTDLESDWNLVQKTFSCCGVHNSSDWGVPVPQSCCENGLNQCLPSPKDPSEPFYKQGCLGALKTWFENNFLTTGVAVIVLCVVEVLGMCIAMTLFCHISSSGLSYKL